MLTFDNIAYAIPKFLVFCVILYIVAAITWAFVTLAYKSWKKTLFIAEVFVVVAVLVGFLGLGYVWYTSGASSAVSELSSLWFSVMEFSRLAKERLVS